MELDVRTLYVVHTLVTLCLASLMGMYRLTRPATPGFGLWAAGMAAVGIGTLGGALRGVAPDLVTVIASNGSLLMGMLALWNGIRQFAGRRTRWRCGLAAATAVVAFLAHRTYVEPDFLSRVLAMSGAMAAGCLLCAAELLKDLPRSMRPIARVAATVFVIVAAAMITRAAALALSSVPPEHFARSSAQAAYFLISLVGNVLTVFCLLLLAAQRLRRELEQRYEDLTRAHHRAEEASQAKSRFLATMSHELRTPLNAIIGFSDMQRAEIFGPLGHPRYREYADDINASGHHLLGLITSILDISKAEAGKLEISPHPIALDPLLQDISRLTRTEAARRRVALSLEVADGIGPFSADPQAIRQILLNLLSNAIKFTPAGGSVALRIREEDGGVAFRVIDDGIGMDKREIPRLLRPFEQATAGLARVSGGSGLGLSIVDALARLHGGTLWIDSKKGEGTAATVWIPIRGMATDRATA
jgi:signal transduction histidine kinase